MLKAPINFQQWIDDNRHLLKPPVGNKCIVDGDFIVMVVGGPNARTDYHWDEGPEFFYQLEGEMVLKVQEDGHARDIPIRAGEIFYLPPRVPHLPQRLTPARKHGSRRSSIGCGSAVRSRGCWR
jgi:3-hydroxyanthranilate 3,4-dioxygenase